MPIFVLAVPAGLNSDPARVDAFLVNHGYVLADGSSVSGDGLSVTVNVDHDPTADFVKLFTNAPTPGQTLDATALATMRAYVQAVVAIPAAQRTPEQKVITAMLRLLAQISGS